MRSPIVVLALTAASALAATGAGAAAPSGTTLQKALDAVVADGAPGAILYVRNGDRVVRFASGDARVRGHVPARPTDDFRIASVTKSFVATVVLQLVAEGRLSLDDTVGHLLPGRFAVGRNVTVRELLQQTSGLYDYFHDNHTFIAYLYLGAYSYTWTPDQLLAVAAAHPPYFAPGRKWKYSNTNYLVLGLIIEAVTHHPIASELRSRIFAPLHLRHTGFETGGFPGAMHGYTSPAPNPIDRTAMSLSPAWAAGAITSTTDDLATFYRALLQGRLLPPKLLHEMETTVPTGRGAEGYGLGLWRTRSIALFDTNWPCGPAWGHNGNYFGYQTYAYSSLDGKRQFVLFVNLDENSVGEAMAKDILAVGSAAYCY